MTKGKFFLGAMFGAAIGAVAGLLTAPKSGKETRADLMAKGGKVKSDINKKADEYSAKASKSYSDIRGKVNEVAEDVKENASDLMDRTGRAVEGAKKGFNTKSPNKK